MNQATAFAGLQVTLTVCSIAAIIVVATERTSAAFYEAAVCGQVMHISGTPTVCAPP